MWSGLGARRAARPQHELTMRQSVGILEQSPCQTDKNIHIAGICYGRVGEVCRQQDPKRSSEQNKHRAFRKQEVAEGRPYFQNTIFSYNARYVKYREVKKPSFPDFGPFHGFWSRPGSGFSLQTDFAFLWLNCVFFLVGVFHRVHSHLKFSC